jgi:hypothetical protein
MTVNYQADDRIQSVECMSFNGNKNERVQGGQIPALRFSIFKFSKSKTKKSVLLRKRSLVSGLNYTILDCNI